MNTKLFRRISQIIFLGLFIFLVFSTSYSGPESLKGRIPVDLFVRLDPLVAGATMLAARTVIRGMMLSLIIVVLTILLGRVFCGWLCPLGTTLDLSDKLFFKRRGRGKIVRLPKVKYYILAGLFITALFTMQAVYFFDPLSLLTRTVALVFFAPIQMLLKSFNDLLQAWYGSPIHLLSSASGWLSDKMSAWQVMTGAQVYYGQSFIFAGIFAAIIGLNSLSRRFWCRNLCPLGALLGLLSAVPILKRVVNNNCIDCGRCIRDCKMAAIPENPRLTRSAECIECFDCVPICPKKAESFRLRPRPAFAPETRLDLSRRRILQGAGLGLAFAALAKVDPGRKYAAQAKNVKLSSQALIRPPGALPEDDFINRCVRCGGCMKACPTGGLQPALHEAGIEGFWTPILVPRIGCCAQECTACGHVCPTGAIRQVTKEEKSGIFLGTAVINHSNCIAWNADKQCLVCDEYCSYHAVHWKVVNGTRKPFVDDTKCVGCGACENACPIQPTAAIRVYSIGDKRT